MATTEVDKLSQEVDLIDPELRNMYVQWAMMLPGDDETGLNSMLEQLARATTWEQLDDLWDAGKAADIAGRRLKIESVTRRPSDFRQGFGFFLVVKSVDVDNGEMITWLTGATMVVAQLVLAYVRGWFPCVVRLVIAERATADGYHPHHLEFLAASKAEVIDDAGA